MKITKEYLKRFNEELIKTFKQFKLLCETYNLKYYAYGGTCIGAVRHNNIIPWDDDIDILMPREDYYKFLTLKSRLCGTGFDIISYRDGGYYFPFTKFINTSTTIWEHLYNPFLIGVFVDVFPLYTTDESDERILRNADEYMRLYGCAARSIANYPLSRFVNALRCGQYTYFLSYAKSVLLYGKHKSTAFMNAFEQYESSLNKVSGEKVVSYCSRRYGVKKEIFKAEWFEKSVDMPFADTDIRVPIGYDSYLKFVYGDYMQLPPIEKRVPDHDKYYVNINERLTIEEVKKRIKLGEDCVY